MEELEWIKQFEEEMTGEKVLPETCEAYCWENHSKQEMTAKIQVLKRRVKKK